MKNDSLPWNQPLKKISFFIIFILFLGCQKESLDDSKTLSLFGKLEMEVLESTRLTPMEQSVGSLQMVFQQGEERFSTPLCSAVRISPRHILTAWHCIKESPMVYNPFHYAALPLDGQVRVETFERVVRLFYDGLLDSRSEPVGQKAPLLHKPLFTDEGLDVAVFELPKSQAQSLDSHSFLDLINLEDTKDFSLATLDTDQAPFPGATSKAFQGSSTALRVYGYPHGLPLTKSLCHRFFYGTSKASKNSHIRFQDPLPKTDGNARWLFHDCDVLGGHSGGLIAFGQVGLALHLAGPGPNEGAYYRQNGHFEDESIFVHRRTCGLNNKNPCKMTPEDPIEKGFNRAIPLGEIKKSIQINAPELWNQLVGLGSP